MRDNVIAFPSKRVAALGARTFKQADVVTLSRAPLAQKALGKSQDAIALRRQQNIPQSHHVDPVGNPFRDLAVMLGRGRQFDERVIELLRLSR